jgi:hypothetical protein
MADQTITLDVINVSKPCLASWDAMRGNDQLRFCDGCGKNVHNLSAMTKRQAADLLEACAGAGELCVRFARLPDGAVATLDYRAAPTGGSRGWRFWAAFGTCLAAGVAAVNALVFRKPPPPVGGPTRVMGVMAMSAPTPPPPAPVRTTPEPPTIP